MPKKKKPRCIVCEAKGKDTIATTEVNLGGELFPVCEECAPEAKEFLFNLE